MNASPRKKKPGAPPGREAAPPARKAAPKFRTTTSGGPTSNAILEAALRVFARDGFDGASLQEIARRSAIGHPLIHYHFGSKENLWKSAIGFAFGELRQSLAVLEQASAGLDPVDALRLLCRGFAQFTARHPAHLLILLNEIRSGGQRFDWIVAEHLQPLHGVLDRAIEAAVRSGRLKPVPTVHLSSIAIGAITHFFGAAPLVARLYEVDVHDSAVIEDHVNWVLDILMHGLLVDSRPDPAPVPGPRA